ncbi:MAG: twin-arginine translocase subunit TatC [Clostridiales bacterium]|nr:twin-arginine translocase subunit TatC [Clostridiales bacterium]
MSQTQDTKQSVFSHLAELRKILVISAGTIAVAFFLVFYFASDMLMTLLLSPITARGIEVIYTAMSEALMTKMKVSLIAAVVLVSPILFWQLWRFIKPALYPHEKHTVRLLFAVTVFLFLLGVVFCYSAVYMLAVDFFIVSGENLAVPMLSIDKYVSFLFGFVIPFGLAFELPVALYLTTRMGLTSYQMLAPKRKFIILAVAVIAAILTPPDVVSQVMLGIPILLLFELSLLICRHTKPHTQPASADEA